MHYRREYLSEAKEPGAATKARERNARDNGGHMEMSPSREKRQRKCREKVEKRKELDVTVTREAHETFSENIHQEREKELFWWRRLTSGFILRWTFGPGSCLQREQRRRKGCVTIYLHSFRRKRLTYHFMETYKVLRVLTLF